MNFARVAKKAIRWYDYQVTGGIADNIASAIFWFILLVLSDLIVVTPICNSTVLLHIAILPAARSFEELGLFCTDIIVSPTLFVADTIAWMFPTNATCWGGAAPGWWHAQYTKLATLKKENFERLVVVANINETRLAEVLVPFSDKAASKYTQCRAGLPTLQDYLESNDLYFGAALALNSYPIYCTARAYWELQSPLAFVLQSITLWLSLMAFVWTLTRCFRNKRIPKGCARIEEHTVTGERRVVRGPLFFTWNKRTWRPVEEALGDCWDYVDSGYSMRYGMRPPGEERRTIFPLRIRKRVNADVVSHFRLQTGVVPLQIGATMELEYVDFTKPSLAIKHICAETRKCLVAAWAGTGWRFNFTPPNIPFPYDIAVDIPTKKKSKAMTDGSEVFNARAALISDATLAGYGLKLVGARIHVGGVRMERSIRSIYADPVFKRHATLNEISNAREYYIALAALRKQIEKVLAKDRTLIPEYEIYPEAMLSTFPLLPEESEQLEQTILDVAREQNRIYTGQYPVSHLNHLYNSWIFEESQPETGKERLPRSPLENRLYPPLTS